MRRSLFAVLALAITPLAARAADVALEGNCAVCLVETRQVVPGSDRYAVEFDRQLYYFPSDKEKQMFISNPARYAPALGGDCVVCRANKGVRVPGKVDLAVIHDQRAYLFPSASERDVFKADLRKYESVDLGLAGYCSVCAVVAKKWVPGKSEFTSVYDGIRYHFPSAAEKKAFELEPAKFTPALEGDCVVCFKNGGKRVAGSLEFSAMHGGRLYLFPDAATRQQFLASPDAYADADIAAGGNCVACAKMMKKAVPGSGAIASVYKGQRYYFPSKKERAMFDAAPAEYAVRGEKQETVSAASIRVIGKTACAGCSYGIRPTTDSDSLGIAVVTENAVYVVEGGEKRYPELFDARFDGINVELHGSVRKKQGKFVWVEPTTISRVR